MKELIATTPKELAIAVKLMYAEKLKFSVRIIETDKKKIIYGISADNAVDGLEETYRILIS